VARRPFIEARGWTRQVPVRAGPGPRAAAYAFGGTPTIGAGGSVGNGIRTAVVLLFSPISQGAVHGITRDASSSSLPRLRVRLIGGAVNIYFNR